MTVNRTHIGHETRYAVRDNGTLRCVLVFDGGEGGSGPAVWKILLPGPNGTEDLYGTRDLLRPDSSQLEVWLTPLVGPGATAELAAAVKADPPAAAARQHRPDR